MTTAVMSVASCLSYMGEDTALYNTNNNADIKLKPQK